MTDHDTARGIENDPLWLQNELNEALKTIRSLRRQLNKELQRQAETERAQNMTIANLADAGREQVALRRERDLWRKRAEGGLTPFHVGDLTIDLTPVTRRPRITFAEHSIQPAWQMAATILPCSCASRTSLTMLGWRRMWSGL